MNKIGFWINNARHIALPQSVLPALLAFTMAATHSDFSWWLGIIALFGIICAHLGMNLADDYFDYKVKSGENRNEMAAEGIRARIAKYPYLTSGQATVKQLVGAIFVFLLIACMCGAVIFYFRGINILYLTLIGGFLGISYSGWPFRLCYHGYGELVIGVMFGPLLMIGMQYAAAGVFDANIILVSVPVGLLVTNIVYSHSIMDAIPDEKVGKMTFARLLAKPKWMILFSAIFNLMPFVIIAIGVILGVLHVAYLSIFILLPMGIYLVKSLNQFINQQTVDIKLKSWMGPMGEFDKYREASIDWFMLRWLIARNLVTFFCLILAIVNIILIFI
ncbi:MAG TPA: prenyltransferase [Paludibacteraceae bacterium]|nr:prenyltransferase [Paludibacteraceae bacterium]HQB68597.1 prenyltransferase [Paludibacteraceae bacterium]